MAKNKLSARGVLALSKPGKHSDGGGLYLRIDRTGSTLRRRWVYLFTLDGKRREMGLGGFPDISLAAAREARDAAERQARVGVDPIAARNAASQPQQEPGKPTFGDEAASLLQAMAPSWRNAKHAWQWRHTLTVYAAPLAAIPVDEVDTADVLAVLQTMWQDRQETASRLRGRIETVLNAARARGNIPQDRANPARWKGHLDRLLPRPPKAAAHHPAMPYGDVPAFMVRLRQRNSMAALCLEFTILTAARSGEALGARWDEIDLKAKVWTIPASRMKAHVEHSVPLSGAAAAILEKLAAAKVSDFVFTGFRTGKPLSNMAMEMLLRRMKIEGATVHGFRSSFRDWAGDETDHPREVAEAALAHAVGNSTELAYRRGSAFAKRSFLMQAWADYLRA